MRYLVLLMIFFLYSFADDHKRILFISSYDLSFPTVKKQIQGIREVLNEKSYQLDIEFMDTKRLDPEEVELIFFQLLNIKQEVLKNYDAILVGDDNALYFIKNYQKAFFNKKPIVFFAVNDVAFAREMAQNRYITGVIEQQSINDTFDVIHKLQPNEPRVTVIIDNTITAKGIVNSFDKETLKKVDFLNLSNYSFSEFEKQLKTIPKNKPLLYISALIDKNLYKKEFYRTIQFIKNATSSPIYHFYEHGIGEGLLGGKVVVFKEQGKQAAIILKNVLEGKNIAKIEPTTTENKYIFDYKELKKFNLLDNIPKASILINNPKSFLDQPLVDILFQIILVSIIILLYVAFSLYKLYKSSKKIKEKTIEQAGLLSLFDVGDTVLFKWNNDAYLSISHISKNVENLLGYTVEEFLNGKINYTACIHRDDIQRVQEETQNNKELFFRHTPYRLITKNKKVKWVIDYTVLIKNEKNEVSHFLGYLLDITKEKKIQNTLEKLIDSQNSIICLSNGKQLTFANKKFYEFFQCNTIKEFQGQYNSISSLFIKNDRFFHLGKIKKDELWMEKIIDFPENERVVSLSDSNLNNHSFSLSSNKFDDDLYLISLTDISETVTEQIKLEEKTIRDKLTGAYNREFFENKYKSMISESKKLNKQLGIAILDIDFFKKINDNNGHEIGDYVLKELVQLINQVSREDDILIRWGGEEFILVLKVNSINGLFNALEHIREEIESHNFKNINKLTCSTGASLYNKNEEIEKTIKRADLLLYRAKEEGRNRVLV